MKRALLLWLGLGYLAALLIFAIFGPHFRYDYSEPVGLPNLPSGAAHWCGTDELGRDTFARLAFGARISLIVGFVVQGVSISVGVLMGILGVYAPRWIGNPLMRLTDAMFAFPDILLAILIVGVIDTRPDFNWAKGPIAVIAALSVTAWPSLTRLVKTQAASLKEREFVVAAKSMGGGASYVVRKHLLPQLWGILLAVGMVELAGTILAESTLSFLGIGIQPPTPSWGSMIYNGWTDMNSHPMKLFWPCLTLSLTIFALNFVGDGVSALLDPKSS